MKISSPVIIKSAAVAGAWLIRGWVGSSDVKITYADSGFVPARGKKYLFGFWHENILPVVYSHCCEHVATLVSKHRDGEFVSNVIKNFKGKTFRGSTTRGGAKALREMIAKQDHINLAITPDGHRGPRRVVQHGAIYLASKTQMPFIPLAFSASKYRRAGSWDSMLLPKLFCRIRGVFGSPILIPSDLSRDDIETYRKVVQEAMDETQLLADKIIEDESQGNQYWKPRQFNAAWLL